MSELRVNTGLFFTESYSVGVGFSHPNQSTIGFADAGVPESILVGFNEDGLFFKGGETYSNIGLSVPGDVNFTGDATVNGVPIISLPIGAIVYWSSVSLPSGWALCDGSSGTPDLRELFIIGGSSAGDTGGSLSKTTSSDGSHTHSVTTSSAGGHTHTFSVFSGGVTHSLVNLTTASNSGSNTHSYNTSQQMSLTYLPSHTHSGGTPFSGIAYSAVGSLRRNWNSGSFEIKTPAPDGSSLSHTHSVTQSSHAHTHTLTFANGGSHTHTISTVSTVASHTHTVTFATENAHTHTVTDSRPPYHALYAIIRVV